MSSNTAADEHRMIAKSRYAVTLDTLGDAALVKFALHQDTTESMTTEPFRVRSYAGGPSLDRKRDTAVQISSSSSSSSSRSSSSSSTFNHRLEHTGMLIY